MNILISVFFVSFSFVGRRERKMAPKESCCCMPLRTSCIVIGASDLLMLAAIYNSQYAYRIDQKLAIICIAPSVLLLVGATVKDRRLMMPWYIFHSLVAIGLLLACILMVIEAFNPNVGALGVIWKIDEIVFDRKVVISIIDSFSINIFEGEHALKMKIFTTFIVYLVSALALYFVCAYRTSAVGKCMKELKDDEQGAQRTHNALTIPNESDTVYLIMATDD